MPQLDPLDAEALNALINTIHQALNALSSYAYNLEFYEARRYLDSIERLMLSLRSFLGYLGQRYSIAKPRENEEKEDA